MENCSNNRWSTPKLQNQTSFCRKMWGLFMTYTTHTDVGRLSKMFTSSSPQATLGPKNHLAANFNGRCSFLIQISFFIIMCYSKKSYSLLKGVFWKFTFEWVKLKTLILAIKDVWIILQHFFKVNPCVLSLVFLSSLAIPGRKCSACLGFVYYL